MRLQAKNISDVIRTEASIAKIDMATFKPLIDREREALDKVDDHLKVPLSPKPCNVSA